MGFIRTNYRYSSVESLPNQGWVDNFASSTLGNSYEVLYDDTTNTLLSSATEVSVSNYASTVDSITSGMNVLQIGYGIGYLNSFITAAGANLTIIEKEQAVMDLERGSTEGFTIIIADPYTYNYTSLGITNFDIVIWDHVDTTSGLSIPIESLEDIISDNGQIKRYSPSKLAELRTRESRATSSIITELNAGGYFRSYSKQSVSIYTTIKEKLKEKIALFRN